jgi:hypothetical protein
LFDQSGNRIGDQRNSPLSTFNFFSDSDSHECSFGIDYNSEPETL